MDIITLALAKKYANKVAAGFSSVSVEDNKIIFTLNDGKTAEMTVPAPKDGVSITDVEIDKNNDLICTLSNGEIINAGNLPTTVEGGALPDDVATKDFVRNEGIVILYPDEGDDYIYANRTLFSNRLLYYAKSFVLTADMYFADDEMIAKIESGEYDSFLAGEVPWDAVYIPSGNIITVLPQEFHNDPVKGNSYRFVLTTSYSTWELFFPADDKYEVYKDFVNYNYYVTEEVLNKKLNSIINGNEVSY